MAETILLIREGNKLGACDPIGAEVIQAMRHGEQVLAEIKRARHPAHHRKMFALFGLILDNQDRYKTIKEVLSAIKIGVGHCTWGTVYFKGIPVQVAIPKSISWANMPQDDFEKFYNGAVDYVIAEIIPGLDRGDLERQVMEFM